MTAAALPRPLSGTHRKLMAVVFARDDDTAAGARTADKPRRLSPDGSAAVV